MRPCNEGRTGYFLGHVQTYDLIIVGGGPAGATAALYAQRHGLAALLLDKQCFPRDKICGDALSGKTVAILHELGLFAEVCKLPGAAVTRIVFGSPDATAASIDLSRYDLHNALTGRVLPMEALSSAARSSTIFSLPRRGPQPPTP